MEIRRRRQRRRCCLEKKNLFCVLNLSLIFYPFFFSVCCLKPFFFFPLQEEIGDGTFCEKNLLSHQCSSTQTNKQTNKKNPMAIFGCQKCGFTMERMVSNAYRRKILERLDQCPKCDKTRRFQFLSHSGMVGKQENRPMGVPAPSDATLWWRKNRDGKAANSPLDAVCKRYEY